MWMVVFKGLQIQCYSIYYQANYWHFVLFYSFNNCVQFEVFLYLTCYSWFLTGDKKQKHASQLYFILAVGFQFAVYHDTEWKQNIQNRIYFTCFMLYIFQFSVKLYFSKFWRHVLVWWVKFINFYQFSLEKFKQSMV